MTKIKAIKLRGWKSLSCTIDVSRLNLLSAGNGAGKSAILSGLQYAVCGTTPHGRDLASVTSYMSVHGGSVEVILVDGYRWERGVHIASGGERSSYIEINGRRMTIKDGERDISHRVGSFAPMFDLRDFVDLSSEKRRLFIFDLLDSRTKTNRSIATRIKERVPAATPIMLSAIGASQDQDDVLGIDVLIEAADREKRFARKLRDESQEAARALGDKKSNLPIDGRTADQLSELLFKAREQLLEMERQKANQAGRKRAIEAFHKKIQSLTSEIAAHQNVLREIPNHPPEMDTVPSPPVVKGVLLPAYSEAEKKLGENTKAEKELNIKFYRAEIEKDSLSKKLRDHDESDWVRVEKMLAEVTPTQDTTHSYQSLVYFVAEKIVPGVRDRLVDALAAIESDISGLTSELDAISARKDELIREFEDAKSAKEAANKRYLYLVEKYKKDVDVKARVDRDRANRKHVESSLERAQADLLAVETQLREVENQGGFIEESEIRSAIDGYRSQCDELVCAIERKKTRAVIEEQIAGCITTADKHDGELQMYALIAAAARALREEELQAALSPLMSRMAPVLSFFSAAPFCELENEGGKTVFRIGWEKSGKRVTYETMSGGERAIFGAALAYAIVSLADTPLRLLMIEAGEVDQNNLPVLLEALSRFTIGIDHVFLATHASPVCDHEGPWNKITFPLA